MQLLSALHRLRRTPPALPVIHETRPIVPRKSHAQETIDKLTVDEKDNLVRRVYDAYFRRFGKDAPEPCCGFTRFTDRYGDPTIVIGNARHGQLAAYRINYQYDGKHQLRFVD